MITPGATDSDGVLGAGYTGSGIVLLAGLRWDRYRLLVRETAWSPRFGAARYWPSHRDVMMNADGYTSSIQQCRSEEAACNAALKWQKKENAAVTKEAKRLASLTKV